MSGEVLAALLDDLRRDEGLRLKPYTDTAGKLTIGYGHNLTDRGITRAQAEALLRDDVLDHLHNLETILPWALELDPVRQRLLGNLAFNMGLPTLLGFRIFLHFAARGEHKAAALALQQSRWFTQVGDRGERIVKAWRDGVDPD